MTRPRLDPAGILELRRHAKREVEPLVATASVAARRRWLPASGRRWSVLVLVGTLLTVGLAAGVAGAEPSPASRQLTTPLALPRMGWLPAVSPLLDGRVLIVGTSIRDRDDFPGEPAAWILDPETRTFEPTGAPSAARQGAVAATLPDGRVLVAGGESWIVDQGSCCTGVRLASAEIYDPRTGTFAPTSPMATARGLCGCGGSWEHASSVTVGDGRVLIVGGRGGSMGGRASFELFDPVASTFRRLASAPVCDDSDVLAVLLADGRVLVRCMDSDWLFDPLTDSFASTGALRDAAQSGSVSISRGNVLPDGRVLVTGALRPGRRLGQPGRGPAELYDPATGTFTVLDGPNPGSGPGSASVTLEDGRVLFLTREQEGPGPVLVFDPTTTTFTSHGRGPAHIVNQGTATRLDDGRILAIAGDGDGVYANLIDPIALPPPHRPAEQARRSHREPHRRDGA